MSSQATSRVQELVAENQELRARLAEAEDTLRAIRTGEVDALVVSGEAGEQIFTLHSADETYRILVEAMNEGALSITREGMVLYCNRHFASMLKTPQEQVIGSQLGDWLAGADGLRVQEALTRDENVQAHLEVSLRVDGGGDLKALLSFKQPERLDSTALYSVVVTDLTEPLRHHASFAAEKEARFELEQAGRARRALLSLLEDETRAREQLAASERELRALFAAMHDLVLTIDRDGIYREIAPTNHGLLILPPAQLLGKSLHDVFPPQQADEFQNVVRRVLETRALETIEYELTVRGAPMWFSASITPLDDEATVWVIHDITDRKWAEQETRQRAAEFEALYEMAGELAAEQDVRWLLQTIVSRAIELLHAASGGVYLYHAARSELEVVAVQGPELPVGTRVKLGEGMSGRVAQTREPIIVSDYRQWEHRLPEFEGLDFAASVEVPMLFGGELIGVLAVNERGASTRQFTARDAQLLGLFASQAASAVHNARLLDETRARANQLAAAYDAGLALNSVLEPQRQLEFLFKIATRALHAERAEFFRYVPEENALRYQISVGFSQDTPPLVREWAPDPDDTGTILGWVSKNRLPLSIPDVRADARWRELGDREVRSGLWCPVEHEGKLLGTLGLMSNVENRFTPHDERMLVLFANQAAVAMENARLLNETRQQQEKTEQGLQRLAALHKIDLAIASSFDLDLSLRVLLEQAGTQLLADAAVVLRLDLPTQSLRVAAGWGLRPDAALALRLPLREAFADFVVSQRRSLRIPDVARAEAPGGLVNWLRAQEFRACHAAPVTVKGALKGMLLVLRRTAHHPDADWLAYLEALANAAALAVDSHEMFSGMQRSNIELALAYDATIEGWSRALDLRDKETEGHTQRVTGMTLRLARTLGVSDAELVQIQRGALLHDIGKMGVPDAILLKPGPLTDEEWVAMRRHPQYAYDLLAPISFLRPALDIPYCHHERWDGTGYPRGLKGEEIPLAARLFAVVDVWDALSSDRPYRKAWRPAEVLNYLREQSGSHFDPNVVRAFMPHVEASGAGSD